LVAGVLPGAAEHAGAESGSDGVAGILHGGLGTQLGEIQGRGESDAARRARVALRVFYASETGLAAGHREWDVWDSGFRAGLLGRYQADPATGA